MNSELDAEVAKYFGEEQEEAKDIGEWAHLNNTVI
jgi:hypothetical protein